MHEAQQAGVEHLGALSSAYTYNDIRHFVSPESSDRICDPVGPWRRLNSLGFGFHFARPPRASLTAPFGRVGARLNVEQVKIDLRQDGSAQPVLQRVASGELADLGGGVFDDPNHKARMCLFQPPLVSGVVANMVGALLRRLLTGFCGGGTLPAGVGRRRRCRHFCRF